MARADACITVTVANSAPSGSVVTSVYLGSFNPAGDKCINYLADAGYFVNASHPSQSFSFNVSANAVFVVNILTDSGGMPYTLAVSGGNCRPVLNVARGGASSVKLEWTTAAPGYHLESAKLLNGVPWLAVPPNPPMVVGGKFTVTKPTYTGNNLLPLAQTVSAGTSDSTSGPAAPTRLRRGKAAGLRHLGQHQCPHRHRILTQRRQRDSRPGSECLHRKMPQGTLDRRPQRFADTRQPPAQDDDFRVEQVDDV